jgi:hypothetical protein
MSYQLSPFLVIVPPQYVSALLKLHEKLEGKNIEWAISGDLGELFKGVRIQPDCIEIVTSKIGADQIYKSVKELNPEPIAYKVQQLPRNAVVGGVEYPLYCRSYYFEFQVDGIKVRVNGELQFNVNNWGWGDKFEFNPTWVYIVNKKTAVVPLSVKYELYQNLGWTDRMENINRVISNRQRLLHQSVR